MTFALQALPRRTTYEPREVTASVALRSAVGSDDLPLNRKGDRWAFDVTVPALDARACGMGLVVDLTRAKTEPVVMPVPDRMADRDYGAPVLDGATAGTILPLRGLTPGVVIPKGKWLSIVLNARRFLYLNQAEATANAAGKAVLTLTQMQRWPGVDGAVVELRAPKIEGLVPAGQTWSLASLPVIGLRFTIGER